MVPKPEDLEGDQTPVRGCKSGRQQAQQGAANSAEEKKKTSITYREGLSQEEFIQKFGDSLKELQEGDVESFAIKAETSSEDSDEDTFVTMQEMEASEAQDFDLELDKPEADDSQEMIEVQEATKLLEKRRSSSALSNNGSTHESNNNGLSQSLLSSSGSDHHQKDLLPLKPVDTSIRRMSRRFSREIVKRRSSLVEAMPETPAGWSALASVLASISLGHELRLQKKLTCPPYVFGQCGHAGGDPNNPLQKIYELMTERPDSILSRDIRPSLFVGTRGAAASTASFLLHGPKETDEHITFRQVLTMSADGAQIAVDWELPPRSKIKTPPMSDAERKQQILTKGGILQPVVLVLHGMNNDSSFGYVRSLMRICTNHGYVTVAPNFRGCGNVPLATPRFYNGGLTADLRGVIQSIETRLAKDVPMFLVGNSLGANLVTKYLGEEGLSGTLPSCIAGGVALGNPLLMHDNNLTSPLNELLALGIKKDLLLNWRSIQKMNSTPGFREAIHNVLKARGLGEVDEGFAPIFARNEPVYPFSIKIGYENAEAYRANASSCHYIKHISVPCLQIVAGDDMIVYKSFQKKLVHCIQNPNVMCVETKCGGHLGWQESPPDASNMIGAGTSWADKATLDFFEAIIKIRNSQNQWRKSPAEDIDVNENRNMTSGPASPNDISIGAACVQNPPEMPQFRSKL